MVGEADKFCMNSGLEIMARYHCCFLRFGDCEMKTPGELKQSGGHSGIVCTITAAFCKRRITPNKKKITKHIPNVR